MRCDRCTHFLHDAISSIKQLSCISHNINKKRWNKYAYMLAPILVEIVEIIPRNVYIEIKNKVFESYKNHLPERSYLSEGKMAEDDIINILLNTHAIFKQQVETYNQLADSIHMFFMEHGLINKPYDTMIIEIIWVTCLDNYMSIYNEIHLGAKH